MASLPARQVRSVAALLVVLAFAVLLHYPLLGVRGFLPKDDWRALKFTLDRPLHPQVERNIHDFGFVNLGWDWRLGRFTPLNNIIKIGEAQVFRDSPALWQIETLGVGIAAAFLFYAVLIRLGVGYPPALLGSLWLIGGGQDLWVEKQFQEEFGLLFVVLALLFFIRGAQPGKAGGNDWAGVGFMALAGLTKETFVFLYPAVVLFCVYLSRFHSQSTPTARISREVRWPLVAMGVLFLLKLGVIVYIFHHGPYAQAVVGTPASFSRAGVGGLIKSAADRLAYFVPALGLAALVPGLAKHQIRRRQYATVLAIIVLWVLPQILVYKNSGWSGHYLVPALVGLAALNVFGLEALRMVRSRSTRLVYWVVIAFSVLAIGRLFPVTRNLAESRAASAGSYTAAARETFKAIGPGSSVLLVADRPWWGMGMTYLIDLSRQRLFCPVFFDYPAFDIDRTDNLARVSIAVNLLSRYMYRLGPEPTTKVNVIMSVYAEKEFLRVASHCYPWFVPQDWVVRSFPVLYSRFRLQGFFPWMLSKDVAYEEYTVWMRKTSSVTGSKGG